MTPRAPIATLAALALACADAPAANDESAPAATADSSAVTDSAAAPTPFVPRDSIVFTFRVSEYEEIFFEPLFVASDTMGSASFEQGSPEADAFEARHYAPGTRYFAASGGVPVGAIELDGAALAACVGVPGDASFVDKVPAVPMRGLAFPAQPPAARFVVPATDAENQLARDSALHLLREAGVPEQKLPEAAWRPVSVVAHPDGSRTIMTTAEISAFEDAEMPAMAFVMLETTPSGTRMVARHAGDGRLLEGGRSEFFDAEDLDGDGAPEIVLFNHYYESWDYTLLRRSAGQWERIFNGGGSGC